MNYLLLGAVFLTIGAQAATVREVQTLSMPVTFGQMLIFALRRGGGRLARLRPGACRGGLPVVVSARDARPRCSATRPLAALVAVAWQILWVGVILRLGAGLFRKTVLKSGPRANWRRVRKA